MNKVMGIIGFIISIICIIACTINVFISIDTYGKNKERINELEKRVISLEEVLGVGNKKEDTNDGYSPSYETDAFIKVKAQELEKISNNKKIVVWIGRQGCGYCGMYTPTITSVGKKYNIDIYYLDLATMYDFSTNPVTIKDEEAVTIMTKFKTNDKTTGIMDKFGTTPMTLIIENNVIINSAIGAIEESDLENVLKESGIEK